MYASNSGDRYALVLAFTGNQEAAILATHELCGKMGVMVAGQRWLEEPLAYELDVAVPDAPELRLALMQVSGRYACDALLVPQKGRLKKLLISDMDSTMIMQECIDEMADMLGIKPQIAEITSRAMNGLLDFEMALRERVALLKGLKADQLEAVWNERITLMPGAQELLATMNEQGVPTVLVSGGFTFFTQRVAERLHFKAHYGNVLKVENGLLTGEVGSPILGADAKLHTMRAWCKQLGIGEQDVLALGDGANDLPMLKAAGMGMACHAKAHVMAETQFHIVHTTLKTALWAQGIATAEHTAAAV
jgi:phosphoserine phosphatase